MARFSTVLLVIYSLFVVSLADPVCAQTVESLQTVDASGAALSRRETSVVLKRSIAETDKVLRDRSFAIDAKEMEKISRQTPQYHRMSTAKMVGIGLAIIATAALVYVLIRYGRECKRREPANCRPGVDQVCVCVDFANR